MAIEIIGEMVAVCHAPTVLPEENQISPETWMKAWQGFLSGSRDRGGGFKWKGKRPGFARDQVLT